MTTAATAWRRAPGARTTAQMSKPARRNTARTAALPRQATRAAAMCNRAALKDRHTLRGASTPRLRKRAGVPASATAAKASVLVKPNRAEVSAEARGAVLDADSAADKHGVEFACDPAVSPRASVRQCGDHRRAGWRARRDSRRLRILFSGIYSAIAQSRAHSAIGWGCGYALRPADRVRESRA